MFMEIIKIVPKVDRRGRIIQRKFRNYKSLPELAEEYGLTRQGINVRLAVRNIPHEKVGSGKRVTTILVHRRYWEELGEKRWRRRHKAEA
jgi:hypothetical protein